MKLILSIAIGLSVSTAVAQTDPLHVAPEKPAGMIIEDLTDEAGLAIGEFITNNCSPGSPCLLINSPTEQEVSKQFENMARTIELMERHIFMLQQELAAAKEKRA